MLRSVPILVLGLDNAGKSSIIKRILGEPIISLVPTVGFNRARVEYGNKYEVFLYDLGGSEDFRTIWKQYLGTAYGVIYVIDSNDFQRTEENRQVFEELLSDENMKFKPLLLLANKQDMEAAMDEVDIVERLNVHTLVNTYKCPTTIELCNTVEPPVKQKKCCHKGGAAHQSDGIQIGFRWLMKQIDEYYDDLQLRIEEILEREQKEYAQKREKWKREKKQREGEEKEEEEEDEEDGDNGNPFKPVDQILSAKNLSNGFKKSERDETNVSNFQIKNSSENLQDNNTSDNHDSKKKQPRKRKKKVAPLNTDDETELSLPPLRLPGRNVNLAWTEETQITNGDTQLTVEEVEDIKNEPKTNHNDSRDKQQER
ncbi:hypothetical protein M8J75_011723 [Diaphorina citri]|nr:hypothetical protein M8J75_011723 [Diaphorina citri]